MKKWQSELKRLAREHKRDIYHQYFKERKKEQWQKRRNTPEYGMTEEEAVIEATGNEFDFRVRNRIEFQIGTDKRGMRSHGRWVKADRYVVYNGMSYPIAVWDAGHWYVTELGGGWWDEIDVWGKRKTHPEYDTKNPCETTHIRVVELLPEAQHMTIADMLVLVAHGIVGVAVGMKPTEE